MLSLIAVAICQMPAVRFVNGIEGKTIDIYSGQLDTVHLDYEGVSGYQQLSGGQISVTNVVDSTSGNSFTNGEPLLISFQFNATVAVIPSGNGVVLALFNETLPMPIDTSKAYVRLMSLSSESKFITLASVSGSIASYAGSMVCTQFVAVDPSVSSLRIYDSQSGTYNSPMITLPTTLSAANAYTVFYFTPSSGPAAEIVHDRVLNGDYSGAPVQPSSTSSDATSESGSGIVQGTSQDGTSSSNVPHSGSSIVMCSYAIIATLIAVFVF